MKEHILITLTVARLNNRGLTELFFKTGLTDAKKNLTLDRPGVVTCVFVHLAIISPAK
jgi:hypothetical protein